MPRPELSTLRYPHLWQGCVGAWCPSQSGATGYRLFDDSGNNNHGVLTNAGPNNWTPDEQKLSINYTGAAASSRMPATPVLNLTGPLTVCTWLKFSSGQGNRGIVAKSGDATQYHLSTGIANNTTLAFTIRSGATNYGVVTNRVYADNSWHFVAGVYDKNNVIINIDGGREIVVGPSVTGDIDLTNPALFIGCFNNGGGSFVGLVDDTRIYNRALAPYEIRQLASSRGAAYERSRGRKKAYVPGYRITAPSRIQTGSARTVDGTATESLSRGLVGAWCPSLGASGFQLIDRSGYGNHGTLTNMDPATDWVPSGGKLALDFDNTDDRVDIAVLSAINSGEVSFSFWYYPFSVTGLNTIFNNWSATVVNVGFYCFRNGTSIVFQQESGSYRLTTGAILTANAWHHVVCRRANGTGGLRVFCNGVLDSASATAGGVQASTAVFNLCGEYGGTGKGNCRIDDLRIYNRALTPSEIRLLYTGGRGVGLMPEVKPKRARIVAWDNQDKISVPARVLTNTDSLKRGLVGHWSPSVSGPQGNRLMDLSGQNNHGTLTNMDYQTDYVPSAEKGGRMALDFDGSDDNIVGGYVLPAPILPNSISAWVNVRSGASNRFSFRSHADVSSSTGVWLRVNGSNAVIAGYGRNTDTFEFGNSFNIATSTEVINSNKWVHIAAIIRGLNNHSIYINGTEATVSYTGTQTAVNGGFVFNIGRIFTGGNNNYGAAGVDDVRYYNRALTPSEIRLLAQSRMPERATPQRTRTVFYSSGLISYLRRRSYNSILGSGVLS